MLGDRTFDTVVEPFCGGATVSLGLLAANKTDRVVISDKDELVSAFWIAAAYHTETLIEYMMDEPVTVARWRYWENSDPDTVIDRAMKALFKNRTTFSGLIRHGSVLGGIDQDRKLAKGIEVKYPVGCRFNKKALAESLRRIGEWAYQGRLSAGTASYHSAVGYGSKDLVYLDPPYVDKSDDLYGHIFTEQCHRDVAMYAYARVLEGSNVLISYDDKPLIRELYRFEPFTLSTPKWAYGMGRDKSSREVLVSSFDLNLSGS